MESKEKMIRVKPILADVTDMTHNEVVEKFGEVFGFKEKEGKILAEIGYIQVEEEKRIRIIEDLVIPTCINAENPSDFYNGALSMKEIILKKLKQEE